ncbi:type I methionyl aminopeptidase [Candidatus Saccharibacteria bacterium]|nr:type I methionyl aminopeptidase [Candidatus Saccharibacteria bacterium]MBQ3263918.1 type I methionyl aminopeptidase [Candidatus Saccharibacteria bacterium]MBQ6321070.1 type I methionyl aminopeptidase [Candidatus Saccharibacteria bacterium]
MINIENSTPTKLSEKITAMREGGKILGNLLRDLKDYVQPGMTGKEIDAWVRKEIVRRGAKVAYDMLDEEFPGAICISVNDALVHGAPKDEPLEPGDKVSFDLDIYYKGYFTDSAFTMIVPGKSNPAVKKMISVTESAMWEGIERVKPGAHIGDIASAVEKVLRAGHLGVIENYVGHGIDTEMHDAPEVPNYGKKGHGYKLVEGDTICIEPMSCLGKPANYCDKDDNWTVKMKDGSIGCHCEHTILVTKDGYEVLTLPD